MAASWSSVASWLERATGTGRGCRHQSPFLRRDRTATLMTAALAAAGCGNHLLKMSCQRQQRFGAAGGFEWLLLGQPAGQHRDIFDDTVRRHFVAGFAQGASPLRNGIPIGGSSPTAIADAIWSGSGLQQRASRETVKSNGVFAPLRETASAFYGGSPLQRARAASLARASLFQKS